MILYLDASAVVKLCVLEEGTSATKQLVNEATAVVTSALSHVEFHAACARKLKEGGLANEEYRQAITTFREDWNRYVFVEAEYPLLELACQLAEHGGLRTLDAIHLASAIFVLRPHSLPSAFVGADHRLQEAAEAEGLKVVTLGS